MNSYLIVSSSEKTTDFLTELISSREPARISVAPSAVRARQLLAEYDFDAVIINSPLKDENGIGLSEDILAELNSSVILLVRSENFEQTAEQAEVRGAFVLEKPVVRQVFLSSLRFLWAAKQRMGRLLEKQDKLNTLLEDNKIINRAKCLLMEHLGLTEAEAHRLIEKQSMDLRRNKRAIAEDVLKTYEM